jgi:heme exporter protein A
MLQLIDIAFDYQDLPLLHEVSFELAAGDLVHLRGANGAGKTTLLKLIAGLYHPSSGEIRYNGRAIQDDLSAYQRQLCFVGHKTGISPYLTIKENCLFDVYYKSDTDVATLASLFKLDRHLNSLCGLLSSGQKRQVGLLRLWWSDATIWLLDEPFVALDAASLTILMNKIQSHREQGGMVLLTSHQSILLEQSAYKEYCL